MNGHLTCKICGYKQFDDECCNYYQNKYKDMDLHDIPYICGACENNIDENKTQIKNKKFDYSYLLKKKRLLTNKILITDINDWFFDIYIFNEYVDSDDVKSVIKKVKEDYNEYWDLDIIQIAIETTFNVKKILKFDDICYNVLNVNDI